MSKQSLDALIASIHQHQEVSAKIKASTKKSLGDFYRFESEIATHELDLSDTKLAPEFERLMAGAGLVLGTHYSDQELKKLTGTFRKNIMNSVQASKKFAVKGDTVIINGYSNNFEQVSQLLKVGVESPSIKSGAYTSLSKFILRYLADNEEVRATISELDKKIQSDPAFAKRTKFGFDVGHTEESSNIYSAIKASIFNSIRKLPLPTGMSEFDSRVKADLLNLTGQMEQMANDPEVMLALAKEYGILDKAQLEKLVELSVGFVRQVASGEVKATLNVEGKLDKTVIKNIANQLKISVFPQYAVDNQRIGSNIEQAIGRHFEQRSNSFATFLRRWLTGVNPFSGKNSAELKGRLPPIPQFEGSPPLVKLAGDSVYQSLKSGKASNVKYGGSSKSTKPKVSAGKPRPKPSAPVKDFAKSTAAASVQKIRRQNPPSIVNIIAIINMRLEETIRANMGRPGGLEYRTGRLAKSAKVLTASTDRDEYIRLQYTYMKNPYQTFEVGYNKGTVARDPRTLIGGSIREIASSIVMKKLRVVRV